MKQKQNKTKQQTIKPTKQIKQIKQNQKNSHNNPLRQVGGYIVLTGAFSAGTLVAFAAFLGQLYHPLMSLVNISVRINQGIVSFERLTQLLDLKPEIEQVADPIDVSFLPDSDPV